jgi:DNA-directed RNA polymerase specialized sigma24 family protein
VALLSSRLELRDIRDVEQFAGRIVERSGLELSYHDREDLLESLIVECWACADKYDPARGAFSTFATYKLRAAVVAWLRTSQERTGRTGFVGGRTTWKFRDRIHQRPQRVLVSLDGAERDRLVEALTAGSGDPAADCDPDRERLLSDRDQARDRDYALLGLDPPRRAA